jgi:hypothetical protein
MSAKKANRKQTISDIKTSKIFHEDEMKAIEIAYSSLVIRCLLPHSLCEQDAWREYQAVSARPSVNQHMHAGNVLQRIVEMFVTLKQIIKEKIKDDLQFALLPSIHLMVDEWYCKLLRQRFIAIRIRYVDENFEGEKSAAEYFEMVEIKEIGLPLSITCCSSFTGIRGFFWRHRIGYWRWRNVCAER